MRGKADIMWKNVLDSIFLLISDICMPLQRFFICAHTVQISSSISNNMDSNTLLFINSDVNFKYRIYLNFLTTEPFSNLPYWFIYHPIISRKCSLNMRREEMLKLRTRLKGVVNLRQTLIGRRLRGETSSSVRFNDRLSSGKLHYCHLQFRLITYFLLNPL